jgi:Putative peptidoglycan binding domain
MNMKRYLISLLLVFPLFVFAQTFDKDLYFGIQKDSDVTKLQEFLTEQGLYSGPISGNFFSLTLAGVKAFQLKQGISPTTGYFGPKSRAKANLILAAQGVSSTGVTDESGSTTPAVTTPPKTTNDTVSALMTQIQLIQQQLDALRQQQQTLQTIQQQQVTQTQTLQQIQQNTTPTPTPSPSPTPTPTPTPPPVPVPQKTISITATALDPTKLVNGAFPGEPIKDGDTVYKTVIEALGPNFPDGVAHVEIYAYYLVDGVKQNTFTGQWSYTPWDFDILGSMDNTQTTFPINCPASGVISGNVCSVRMGWSAHAYGHIHFHSND